MALLKDSVVLGSLRVTDSIYTNTILLSRLLAPTASNGSSYGDGDNTQVLRSNGTSVYWATLGSAADKGITDKTAAAAILSSDTNLITARAVYYGLPTINNAHNYTSSTTIYAPTGGGNANYVLWANGATSTPTWKAPKDALNYMINLLDTGSSNLTANDYVITQYVGGGTTTTTYHRRPASAIRVGGLLNKRKLKVDLSSTTDTTFDGTGDVTNIPINNTLGYAHGGTGQSAWTKGDLLYASANNTLAKLAIGGTAGSVLNVTSGLPSWYAGVLLTGTAAASYVADFKGTTASTSKTTGAVKIAGGLGVNGDTWSTKYNNLTLTAATTGFTIAGGTTSKTLTVSESVTLNGGSATYLAYYSANNSIQGHSLAHFSDTYNSSTKNGKNELVLGNNVASTTNGSAYGQLALYSGSTAGTYLKAADGSSWHTATLQADNGIIAYTDDITTAINALNVNEKGATNGTKYICAISESAGKINATVSAADIGSSHEPIYVDSGTIKLVIGQTIEYIVGTQTATTNNWTGVTADSALYVGKMIAYKLPTAGNSSAAKLTLTLADGTTTAAINLRRQNANVTTHYPAGSIIFLTYDGTYWLTDGDYDSNSNDVGYYIRYSSGTFTAVTTLPRYKVLLLYNETSMLPVNTTDSSADTKETITTDQFLIFGDYAYFSTNSSVAANAAIAVGGTWLQYLFDLRYSFNTASTLTTNKDVYLVATPEADGIHARLRNPGATGTDASAAATGANAGPITQTLPTSDDGFIYIRLGRAYSTTNIVLTHSHPVYWYKDGSVKLYAPPITSVALTTTVNSVAYYTDTTGTLGMKSSANGALYATSANGALLWGTLPVAQGGTGATSFTANSVIISGNTTTAALTTRPIYTRNAVGTLDWASSSNEYILTKGAIAYWNGAYTGTSSNLAYCAKGAFGTIVTTNYPTSNKTAAFLRGDGNWSDTLSGTTFKITNNSNTVTIGSLNNGFCHFTNSQSIPFYFSNTIQANGQFTIYNTTTYLASGILKLSGITTATMNASSGNPRIVFMERDSNGTESEPVYLMYTDYNAYRLPAGLKVLGGTNASPAWFEVEGLNVSLWSEAVHGYYSYRWDAVNNSVAGYIKFASVKVQAGYVDEDIIINYTLRQRYGGTVHFRFSGGSGTDPQLNGWPEPTNGGQTNFYIVKTSTSNWDLYILTTATYNRLTMNIVNPAALLYGNGTTVVWTWKKEFVTSLPSGYGTLEPDLLHIYGVSPNINFWYNYNTLFRLVANHTDGIELTSNTAKTWLYVGNGTNLGGIYFPNSHAGFLERHLDSYQMLLQTYNNKPLEVAGSSDSSNLRHWRAGLIVREAERVSDGLSAVSYSPRLSFLWNGRFSRNLETHSNGGLYVMSTDADGGRGQVYAAGFNSGSGNDYAEERDSLVLQPGKVVTETAAGKMVLADERLLPGCRIVSDTYGMLVGQRDSNEFRAPIAVTGRALVYPYRDRTEYPLGAAVCSAPNGTVDIMTREEIMMYPERIIGTVSEIPTYELWTGSGIMSDIDSNVIVDGRIWVYVR